MRKKKWGKLKATWWLFWGIEESEQEDAVHISRSDKITIWYGCFLVCLIAVTICIFTVTISNSLLNNRYSKDAEDTIKMVAAYLAAATDEEYAAISSQVRNDLTSAGFANDTEYLIQFIPNSAEICWTHWEDCTAQALLVSVNTGYLYDLDIYSENESSDTHNSISNGIRMTHGYDETSKADIWVQKEPDRGISQTSVTRGNGNISFLKMKSNFCDDCIRNILAVVENEEVKEFVIFDMTEKLFYPVTDGSIRIGDYLLNISHTDNAYEISATYSDE